MNHIAEANKVADNIIEWSHLASNERVVAHTTNFERKLRIIKQ